MSFVYSNDMIVNGYLVKGDRTVTHEEVKQAAIALQAGDPTPAQDLYMKMEGPLASLTYAAKNMEREEAESLVALEFTQQLSKLNVKMKTGLDKLFYSTLKAKVRQGSTYDGAATLPATTAARYRALVGDFTYDTDQDIERAVDRAYQACKKGGFGMTPEAFLATHHALTQDWTEYDETGGTGESYSDSFMD